MKKGVAFFLLMFLIIPNFAWTFGDKVCERDDGESCINSQDCPTCYVTLNVSSKLQDTQALFTVVVKSEEPEDLGIILTVKDAQGEEVHYKTFDLPAMQIKTYEVAVMRFKDNQEYSVIISDREINTMWAREFITVKGLATEKSRVGILIPFLAIFVFFGLLYFGLKKPQTPSPYQDGAGFIPYIPRTAIGQPQQQKPVIEEQIVVVTKKKKYYQKRKNKLK